MKFVDRVVAGLQLLRVRLVGSLRVKDGHQQEESGDNQAGIHLRVL